MQDLHADFYGNNLPPERYRMEMAVSVATTDVDTVLKAMGNQSELIQKGVLFTQNYRTQFSFNGLNSIKPEMVEEATKNARSTAQKFAEDSDSELGKSGAPLRDNSQFMTETATRPTLNAFGWLQPLNTI